MKKVVLALFIIFLPTISFAEDINWLYKNRTDATIDAVQTKDMSDKVMVKVNNKNIYVCPRSCERLLVSYSQFVPGITGMNTVG